MFDDDTLDGGWMSQGWTPGTGAGSLTQQEHAFLSLSPELFFASELFQGRYVRSRVAVRDYAVRSTCADRVLLYSGVRLDQFDLDVFLACARHVPAHVTSAPQAQKLDTRALTREVLKSAGRGDLRRVMESLRRLETGRITIRDSRFTCYLQPIQKALFDEEVGLCLIELNPEMLRSLQQLGDHQGFIRERFQLRMVSIDRWLHGVMHSSSRICIPFDGLPALSGNTNARPVQVEKSLNRLRASVRLDRLSVEEGGLEISRNSRVSGGAG
jgi:hypothetical protein